MAITTSGYPVQAMPQYSPVDPALAAFNPNALAQGALSGIQIASSIDQVKAFRQHQEEWAKMANARNALLQSQSDEAVLRLKHQQALADAEIKAQKAELARRELVAPAAGKADVATAERTITTAPVLAQTEVAQAKLAEAQANSAATLVAQQTKLTADQMADLSHTLSLKSKLYPYTDEQTEFATKAAQMQAAAELDMKPEQLELIRKKLKFDVANSQTKGDLELAHLKAQNRVLNAQADNFLAEVKGEGKYAKDPFVLWQKMGMVESQLTAQENKLLSRPVNVPPNNVPGTIIDYMRATRAHPGVDNEPKRTGIPFITRKDVPINPLAESLIEELAGIRRRKAALANKIDSFDFNAPDTSNAAPSSTQSQTPPDFQQEAAPPTTTPVTTPAKTPPSTEKPITIKQLSSGDLEVKEEGTGKSVIRKYIAPALIVAGSKGNREALATAGKKALESLGKIGIKEGALGLARFGGKVVSRGMAPVALVDAANSILGDIMSDKFTGKKNAAEAIGAALATNRASNFVDAHFQQLSDLTKQVMSSPKLTNEQKIFYLKQIQEKMNALQAR